MKFQVVRILATNVNGIRLNLEDAFSNVSSKIKNFDNKKINGILDAAYESETEEELIHCLDLCSIKNKANNLYTFVTPSDNNIYVYVK